MKTNKIGMTFFIGLLFLITANSSFAIDLLTYESRNSYGDVLLRYTYYLDTAGQQVKHGTETIYYGRPL